MRMRDFIRRSPWARVAFAVLLVLLVLVCGVHLAGAHHDGDTDGIGLLDGFASLALLVLVFVAFARRLPVASLPLALARPLAVMARAPRFLPSFDLRNHAPLRC